jgi:hypothetical protein
MDIGDGAVRQKIRSPPFSDSVDCEGEDYN